MNKLFCLVLLGLVVCGCNVVNTLSEGFEHSQQVASDLEQAVGTKPFVGFNWHNGSLTNVSVAFEGIPEGAKVEDIAALSRMSIATRFKQQPQKVVISFTFPGESR